MYPHRPSPFPVRMRVGSSLRDPDRYPHDDDALGRALLVRAVELLQRGTPRPTVLAFSQDHLWWYDLVPAIRQGADVGRLIAAVAGQDDVDCLGVVGVLNVRVGGTRSFPGCVVFLEWPDGRWWSVMLPLRKRADGRLERQPGAEPMERAAIEGWPRPGGLGGWWTRHRVEGLKLRVHRTNEQQVH